MQSVYVIRERARGAAGGAAAESADCGLERFQGAHHGEHVEGGGRESCCDVGANNAAAHVHSDASWWVGKEKEKEAMMRERSSGGAGVPLTPIT